MKHLDLREITTLYYVEDEDGNHLASVTDHAEGLIDVTVYKNGYFCEHNTVATLEEAVAWVDEHYDMYPYEEHKWVPPGKR